jgi:uncharacterized lipoprotein YmbA
MTACSSGPPLRTFVLTPPLAPTALSPTTASPTERIVIRRVLVPDYLDTTDILIRHGAYALDSSRTGRWGERLSLGITHALSADLMQKLPAYRIELGQSETPDSLRLQLEVDSFDVYPDGHCVLAANWTIVQKSGIKPPAFGRGVFATPASAENHVADAELVSAIASTVAQLADAIVGSL